MPLEYPQIIKQQPLDQDDPNKYYPFPGLSGLVKPPKPTQEPVRRMSLTLQPSKDSPVVSASPFHGVTRLSVVVGQGPTATVSETFNNGKGDQTKVGKYKKEVTGHFCFAPGVDKPKICWKVRNTDAFETVKFELYCRSKQDTPIWSKSWSDIEIKQNIRQNGLVAGEKINKAEETIPIAWTGSLDWEQTVVLDKTLKIDGEVAFPDGVLTVKHSPYQLRMIVNDGQPGPQRMGYPLVAWTYIHVLVHSIELAWGTDNHLSQSRPDVAPVYEARVLGYEKEILRELTQTNPKPAADIHHEVNLTSNQFAHKNKGAFDVQEYQDQTDFNEYRRLWGNGARIPLLAKVLIKKADGTSTNQASQTLVGAQLLWDWQDNVPDRWRTTAAANATAASKDYLNAVYNEHNPTAKPAGTNNCPQAYGGKLGDPNAPIFPAQDGSGPFPYVVERCQQRSWAALSRLGTNPTARDQSGVIFQPSRMAGDRYQITASLYFDTALDSENDLDLPPAAQARAGTFEVYRRVKLYYLVRGSQAELGYNPDDCIATLKTRYRQELKINLDVTKTAVDNNVYRQAISAGIEQTIRDPTYYQAFPGLALALPYLVNQTPSPTSPGVTYFDRPEFLTNMEAAFKAGRIRHVQVGNYDQFKIGEELQGVNSQARGVSLKLWSKGLPLVLLAANSPNFQNGEQVRGLASQATAAAVVTTARSCWGRTYRLFRSETEQYKEAIVVDFNGGQELVTVRYEKKTFTRVLKTTLTGQAKQDLRAALDRIGQRLDESKGITIEFRARYGSDNAKRRIEVLKQYFDELFNDEFVVIDRKAIFETLKNQGDHGWVVLYKLADFQNYVGGGAAKLHDIILPAIIEQYMARKYPNDEGIFMLHMPGTNNVRDLADGRKNYLLPPVEGAYFADTAANNRHQGVLYVATVDPNGANVHQSAFKSVESIVCHEVAHALFKAHAPSAMPGSFDGQHDPPRTVRQAHVDRDNCLMNYDVTSEHFCGLCMLRSRGWNWQPISNALEMEYKISLELGDVEDLFANPASIRAGQKERLQVLGLLNRPLDHEDSDECLTFSWEHAKTLFPQLNNASDILIQQTLAQEIKNFLVEGGQLPQPGEFRKMRTPGGFTVFYASALLEAAFTDAEQGTPVAAPYEQYMLEVAKRYQVEKRFYEDNPVLGMIPLVARVKKRPKGSGLAWNNAPAAPEAQVYFQLVAPAPLPGYTPIQNPDNVRYSVAGGSSFYDQVVAPPLAQKPQQYLAAKVDQYKPAGQGDPHAGNVHIDLGGRRTANVFYSTRDQGLVELPSAQVGNKHQHAVNVPTDENGEARLLFAPSRIGGDRYRLRVYIGPVTLDNDGTQPGDAVADTGTLVRWRTIRLCRQVYMPPAQTANDLPAYLKKPNNTPLTNSLNNHLGDIPAIDFKGRITREFARSYCELIMEPAALQRESIVNHAQDIMDEAASLLNLFPDFNKPRRAGNPGVNIFKEDLLPVPGDQTGTQFKTTLTTRPEPDTVTVRVKNQGKDSAIISDESGQVVDTGKASLSAYTIDYNTGEVSVTFTAPPQQQYQIAYFPLSYVDVPSLLFFPAQSPFLLNLRLPDDYNQRIGAGTMPFAVDNTGKPTHAFEFISSQKLGLVKALLMEAVVRGIGRNQGFYPGLVLIQAQALDNYTVIWPSGTQEGKGVELGIYVFGNGNNDLNRLHALALHEMSHGLYLKHAPTASGFKRELHDQADTCVMSYDPNDGDHCGQCVASLRGMNEWHPQLKTV